MDALRNFPKLIENVLFCFHTRTPRVPFTYWKDPLHLGPITVHSSFYTSVLTQKTLLCWLVSQESSRREALKSAGVAFGAALIPMAANAAAGESPRFSVFGLLGDGTAMSEGAAYGSDQSSPLYSPYSVYGETGASSLYKVDNPEYINRSKAVLAETKKRLARLPAYVDKKKWFEVTTELDRYMYETRGATNNLASTPAQKKAAVQFFKAMEETNQAAKLKNQEACAAAASDTIAKLDAFVSSL